MEWQLELHDAQFIMNFAPPESHNCLHLSELHLNY